jgi:protein-L-isoaspartate(D-aspartate) O-methyltransferase
MGVGAGSEEGHRLANGWREINDPRVRAALARMPRAQFVPPELRHLADEDAPLPIGEEQTISQPFVVALMTQLLHLQPADRVLEIGTGSGFQTAILCELTAEGAALRGDRVYSIERFPALAQRAATVLNTLGYYPQLRVGDGAAGWPTAAPFDAIILTAAPASLPRPLWTQLAEGGRLVAPIGPLEEDQTLWLVEKQKGRLWAQAQGPVRFVPLLSPLLADPTLCITEAELLRSTHTQRKP